MKHPTIRSTLLLLALGWSAPCLAQPAPDTDAQKELESARQDLQRAAKRLAELSRLSSGPQQSSMLAPLPSLKPRLGVLLAADDEAGVRITGITPDSGAAKAGLQSGDRLLKISDTPITGPAPDARLDSARAALADLRADAPVALEYQRNGRTHTANVVPAPVRPRVAVSTRTVGPHATEAAGAGMPWLEGVPLPMDQLRLAIAPEVQRELRRLGKLEDCKGDDCQLPLLADALRWSGLNLATVDAQLGRYFGTDSGVLVLSAGRELGGLQAGDVIRSVEGKAVASPREVMDALRGQPEDAKVAIEFLRDRQSRTASITVPQATPLRVPLTRLSVQPRIAVPGGVQGTLESRRMVIIDQDGGVRTFRDEHEHVDTPPTENGTPL